MNVIHLKWFLFAVAVSALAIDGAVSSSLRGALEALQRRQRVPRQFGPASRASPDYKLDDNYIDYEESPFQLNDDLSSLQTDNVFQTPEEKYIMKYLSNIEKPKISHTNQKTAFRERLENNREILARVMNKRKRSSAFRERVHNTNEDDKEENEMFLNKFFNNDDIEIDQQNAMDERDKEYAELLSNLWKKYKVNHKFPEVTSPSDQVIWLYRDINNRKRQSQENYMAGKAWGPVAFRKRKRNVVHDISNINSRDSPPDLSNLREIQEEFSNDELKNGEFGKVLDYNELPPYDTDTYDSDMSEEIGIAFQPFDNPSIEYLGKGEIDTNWNQPRQEKRFPVTKRSNTDIKMYNRGTKTNNQYNKRMIRGGWGTNSKVLKDLSDIFGTNKQTKNLNIQKRSEPAGDSHHNNYEQTKSPQISAMSHNYTNNDANSTKSFVDEIDITNTHQHAPHANKHTYDISEEPNENYFKDHQNINIDSKSKISEKKKRSFKWSDYFGIDKRRKRSVPISQEMLKKKFLSIFTNKITSGNKYDTKSTHSDLSSELLGNQETKKQPNIDLSQIMTVPHDTKETRARHEKFTSNPSNGTFSNKVEITTTDPISRLDNNGQFIEFTTQFSNLNKFKRDLNNMYTFALPNPPNQIVQINPSKRSQDNQENEEVNDFKLDRATILSIAEKREPKRVDPIRLENMDNKLKNLEIDVVEEASNLGQNSDGLDSKEEQEMRERILSRLAAAYSLEKMRKALKEFKHSIEMQKHVTDTVTLPKNEQAKEKKVLSQNSLSHIVSHNNNLNIEKTKPLSTSDSALDKYFESEQGAGQFSNGEVDVQFSEGYMGGSGRRDEPDNYEGENNGNCPSLDKIVTKCRRIDALAGDHGHLFLPLCSLHQICYICGTLSETSCDLIFISEADSMCNNKTECLQAARNSIMLLRELYESMADNLEGECENNPCLERALKYSPSWWNRD